MIEKKLLIFFDNSEQSLEKYEEPDQEKKQCDNVI